MKNTSVFVAVKIAFFLFILAAGFLAVKIYERSNLNALLEKLNRNPREIAAVDMKERVHDEFVIGMSRRGEEAGFKKISFSSGVGTDANLIRMSFEADFRDVVRFLEGLRLPSKFARLDLIDIDNSAMSGQNQIVTIGFSVSNGF